MKKIYYILLVAVISMTLSSCEEDYRWYESDLIGSWESSYGVDEYGEYDIRGYDVVRFDFYSNHTGRYTYYSIYGLDYVDFDWRADRGFLQIDYYDGTYENLYYDFDHGYLLLSPDRYFRHYTAYR